MALAGTKVESAAELIRLIKPGSRIFVHGASATPLALLEALAADAPRLLGSEIMHLHTCGPAPDRKSTRLNSSHH